MGESFTSTNLTTTVTNGIDVSFQWYDNNGINNTGTSLIIGQNNASFTALPTTVGNYSYLVEAIHTSDNTCSASQIVNVSIKNVPTADIEDKLLCTDQSETITVLPTGGTGPYTYIWSGPYDLNGASGASLTTSVPGTYTITVTDLSLIHI